MSKAKLVWITPNATKVMSYCARVSNPKNQRNWKTASKLLAYCIRNQHWSVFEMASMCVEIETSMAIGEQILRHRSFSFQKFSFRYASSVDMLSPKPRRQDVNNRQNSIDDLSKEARREFKRMQKQVHELASSCYKRAIGMGVAKESARFFLPASTKTRMYMSGTVRSWIHYLLLRTDPSTQLEHREVALKILGIFKRRMPAIYKAIIESQQNVN